jgi:hypothetical protein
MLINSWDTIDRLMCTAPWCTLVADAGEAVTTAAAPAMPRLVKTMRAELAILWLRRFFMLISPC